MAGTATVNVKVSCPVEDTFRIGQVRGLFDLPQSEKAERSWSVELPDLTDEWKIGAIVGPSGSGKTVIARHHYGKHFIERFRWPRTKAALDGFDEGISARDITGMFSSVGFSSPPDWVKPYGVLSNGQRFRCDLARALLTKAPVIVFDEFSSVVDRQVAKFGSAAVAKTIRRGRTEQYAQRFVAVTCHYDVLDWLDPDWVLDLGSGASGRLVRRWVQRERKQHGRLVRKRPPIVIDIFRFGHSAWRLFSHHHYLTADLPRSARCYLTTWNGTPVSFHALMPLIAKTNHWRFSRSVVLPDYQGMGIGVSATEAIAEAYLKMGCRVNSTSGHPALISHRSRSPLWRVVAIQKIGTKACGMTWGSSSQTFGRPTVSFEYIGHQQTR